MSSQPDPHPVEKTTAYQTYVPELTDAFAFVMGHVDEVGPDPAIQIKPVMFMHDEDCDHDDGRMFEVTVTGSVTVETKAHVSPI